MWVGCYAMHLTFMVVFFYLGCNYLVCNFGSLVHYIWSGLSVGSMAYYSDIFNLRCTWLFSALYLQLWDCSLKSWARSNTRMWGLSIAFSSILTRLSFKYTYSQFSWDYHSDYPVAGIAIPICMRGSDLIHNQFILASQARPLPAFQCCTLKSERAWYAKSRAWRHKKGWKGHNKWSLVLS